MTNPKLTPFVQNFQTVDKSNLSLPWTNIAQSGTPVWKAAYIQGMVMPFVISGTKVNSNIAWLISPKIDMDTHTKETLHFGQLSTI
jgi:hypothetical protein